MKYTDLHLHLDGSLPLDTVRKLADLYNKNIDGLSFGEQKINHSDDEELNSESLSNDVKNNKKILLPTDDAELRKLLSVSFDCDSLNEYLEKFELPLKLLQTEDNLKIAVHDIAFELEKCDVGYAEIRFAPQLHTNKGMTQKQATDAAIQGYLDYLNECKNLVEIRFILCLMRGIDNKIENMTTVELAGEYIKEKNPYIAGIDLAGAEALFPTDNFEEEFRRARELYIPFTIHAGEADGPESIWKALEFGAKRIGHGIAAAKDEKLMEKLAKDGVILEMCPTSNVQTKAVSSIEEYPLRTFLNHGIKVSINSDNMTVSDTDVKREIEILERYIGLTNEEKMILLKSSDYKL